MKKHWIFHKYKWETYHTAPVFVIGFFQDYTLERRFQSGSCECGAYKYREVDVDPMEEWEQQMIAWRLKVADDLVKAGRVDTAIEVLKL